MFNTTFRPIAEPVYGVMKKAAFLVALDAWAKREKPEFSLSQPPVDSLPDTTCDENAVLAAIFYRLTRCATLTDQIAHIQLELFHHNRRLGFLWNQARGESDPRRRPQRSAYFDLRPYEDMVRVIEDWAEALHDRACETRS